MEYDRAAKKGNVTMRDGRMVKLTPKGFKETKQERGADRDALNLLVGIRDVLAAAYHVTSRAHEAQDQTENTLAWHYYAAKVNIGGREMLARLVLREDASGNIYFDNQLSGMENAGSVLPTASRPKESVASREAVTGAADRVAEMLAESNTFVPSHATDAVTKEPNGGFIERFLQEQGWAAQRSAEAAQSAKENAVARQKQQAEREAARQREAEARQGYIHNDDERPYLPQRTPLTAEQKRMVREAVNMVRARYGDKPSGQFRTVERSTNIEEVAAGFAALAKSEDWAVPPDVGTPRGNNKYFTISKDGVEIPVRVSDHTRTNTGRFYETVAINLVPSAARGMAKDDGGDFAYDTFESALWKLKNARVNEDDILFFGDEEAVYFSRAGREVGGWPAGNPEQQPSNAKASGAMFARGHSGQSGTLAVDAVQPRRAPPKETRAQWLQRRFQDKLNRFAVIRKWLESQGVKLTEQANVYGAEERMHGRFANKVEDFQNKRVRPLVEKITRAGGNRRQAVRCAGTREDRTGRQPLVCAPCLDTRKAPHGRGVRDRRCCIRRWEAIRCLTRGSDGECGAAHLRCQADGEGLRAREEGRYPFLHAQIGGHGNGNACPRYANDRRRSNGGRQWNRHCLQCRRAGGCWQPCRRRRDSRGIQGQGHRRA